MNRCCPEFEPMLLDRVAGVLDDDATLLLERHLAACLPCRTEAATVEQALSLAALPPPSPEEVSAVAAGAPAAAARWRAAPRERRAAARLVLAMAASAAFALAVPWLLHPRGAPGPSAAATRPSVEWEAPDPEAAWAAASVADPSSSDQSMPEMLFAELEEIELDP